jgi:hypothetical protein
MGMWVLGDGEDPSSGDPLVVIHDTPTGMVSINITTDGPIFITPDSADELRNMLGLASGMARGERPPS